MVEGGALNSEEFKNFANSHVLFLHVTSQIPDKKDDDLFRKVGGAGFPTFFYFDEAGGVLASQAGALDVKTMSGTLHDKAKSRREGYLALKKKAAEGDEKAKLRLAVLELEMRRTSLADFRKAHPDISKLDEGSRETVLGMMGMEAFSKANDLLRAAGRDQEKQKAALKDAGKMLLAAAKQQAVPGEQRTAMIFWYYLGAAGATHDDAEMLKKGIEGLEEFVAMNPRLSGQIDAWKMKLKAIETPAGEEEVEEEVEEEPVEEDMG